MTYVIDGKLKIKEKPEMFLNKFVEYVVKEIPVYDDYGLGIMVGTKKERNCIYTNSKRFAKWLNNRGHNLKFIDDRSVAEKMCETKDISIDESRLFVPESGWADYLTKNFAVRDEYETLCGEIELWKETRFPSPILYTAAMGHLEGVFVFNPPEGFVKKKEETVYGRLCKTRYEGKKYVAGGALDTPILNINFLKKNKEIKTITQLSFQTVAHESGETIAHSPRTLAHNIDRENK